MTTNWQHLFPYKYFMSSREIIEEMSCSICEKTITLLSCKHRKGKLYGGKLCLELVTKFKLITFDIVLNPVNKISFIYSGYEGDDGFNWLKFILSHIKSPRNSFDIEFNKDYIPHNGITSPEHICPCKETLKSYKDCCLNKIAVVKIKKHIILNKQIRL